MSDTSERHRHLILTAICTPDSNRAAESWDQFLNAWGGEEHALEWLSAGPPRGLMPFLGTRTESLGISDQVAAACHEATAEAWALNRQVLDDAATVVGHLHEHGIEVMALKGLALAGEMYSPHWLRAIGDIDLLVHPDQHRDSVRVLEEVGWRRLSFVLPPWRGQVSATLIRSHGTTVDIHSRPSLNLPHRFRGEPSCWNEAEPVGAAHPLVGLPLLTPSPESHLVILAAHLAHAGNRHLLHPVLDTCQLLVASVEKRCAPIDVDRLIAAADDEGARGRVAAALELVTGLGAPGPTTLPPASPVSRRQEERVKRADMKRSSDKRGMIAFASRTIASTRVCTIGQGPVATAQVALHQARALVHYIPSGIGRRLVSAAKVLSGETAKAGAPFKDLLNAYFGVADDGALIEVRSNDIDERLRDVWPPIGLRFTRERPQGAPLSVVEIAGELQVPEVRVDGTSMLKGWDAVESALALFAAERLTDLVAVHAAVLVWDGAAVLVPGISFAGKSTLAVAAHAAGAIVASDEFALVDPTTGRVRGWNRPVRQRTPSGTTRVDIATDIEPTPVAVVAAVAFTDGEPALRELSQAEIVMELLANTVCAQSRPHDALAAATAVARTARGVGGTRGEATDAVEVLRELYSRATKPSHE